VAGGFRPSIVLFLGPLLLWTGIRSRRTARQWLIASLLLMLTAGSWLSVSIVATGGLTSYLRLVWDYANTQFQPTSVVFGASPQSAWRMLEAAVVWNGLGVLSWAWALPFVFRRVPWPSRQTGAFLLVSFLPAFLFHAVIHVGDPDHTLITAPVLCLLGALILSSVAGRTLTACAVALAVLLNVALFFRPLPGLAAASSYRAVKYVDRVTRGTFQAIQELRQSGPILLVSYQSPVTWRHLFYYFPDDPLLVLHGNDPNKDAQPAGVWLLRHRQPASPPVSNGQLIVPPGRKLVWLMPQGRGYRRLLEQAVTVKRHDPVVYVEATPGLQFHFGEYRFAIAQ